MPQSKTSIPYEEILVTLINLLLEHYQQSNSNLLGYWDNTDLRNHLHVTQRSIDRWCKKGIIPFKKIGGKKYYPKAFFNIIHP